MPIHKLVPETYRPSAFVEDGDGSPELEDADADAPELAVDFDRNEVVVPVVRRETFAFDGRGSGTTQTMVLANGVDATWWRSGRLLVLGHTKNAWLTGGGGPTTGSLQVVVDNISITEDAPETTFVGNRLGASTPIVATSTLPLYLVSSLAPPFAGQLRVSLSFTQGATAAVAAQTVALSVYLLGRAS